MAKLCSLLTVVLFSWSCTAIEQLTGSEEKTNPATLLALLLASQSSSSSSTFVGHVYLTATGYNGNLGGISGADAKCNAADANKPSGGGTYKAMIALGTTRRACSTANCTSATENIDWVFRPGGQYYRSDRTTLIGTASSAGTFASGTQWHTGSTRFWTAIAEVWTNGANHCVSWGSAANDQIAGVWYTDANTYGNSQICDEDHRLLCVLQ